MHTKINNDMAHYPYSPPTLPGSPGQQPGPLGEGITYYPPHLTPGANNLYKGYQGGERNPYVNELGCFSDDGTVALDSNVSAVINSINAGYVIPYGDYEGPNVYWFQTFENAIGNIIYTIFDRDTNLGLASFMVRFSSASTIRQILFQNYPKSPIQLQFLILPKVPFRNAQAGQIIPN